MTLIRTSLLNGLATIVRILTTLLRPDAAESNHRQDTQSLLHSALHLHQAGRVNEALPLYEQAIALEPKQLRAYTVLASAFNLKGWFDRMEAPVRTALELRGIRVETAEVIDPDAIDEDALDPALA